MKMTLYYLVSERKDYTSDKPDETIEYEYFAGPLNWDKASEMKSKEERNYRYYEIVSQVIDVEKD